MNKRIKQRVDELIEIAQRINENGRTDYNSRLKSFIDKAEKLDKMNKALFKKGEQQECLNKLWDMYYDTLKHLAIFYTASKFIENRHDREGRSHATIQAVSDGIASGEINDALHTNLALEHMGNDGFYKAHKPKPIKSDGNWSDESWNRNTDNSGVPEYVYLDNMSESSLEAMLTSYAVTFDQIESLIDRAINRNSYWYDVNDCDLPHVDIPKNSVDIKQVGHITINDTLFNVAGIDGAIPYQGNKERVKHRTPLKASLPPKSIPPLNSVSRLFWEYTDNMGNDIQDYTISPVKPLHGSKWHISDMSGQRIEYYF